MSDRYRLLIDAIVLVHALHEQEAEAEGHHAAHHRGNGAEQIAVKRISEEEGREDRTVATNATSPTGVRFFAEALDAQNDQVHRCQQVGHRLQVQAVKHDEQADDGVEHPADAQPVHVGKEGCIGVPVKGFVIVDEVVFCGQQGEEDALNCKGQTGHGLTLFVGPNFCLRHHVNHAEGEQNGECNHAVGSTFLKTGAPEQNQSDDGADAEENRVACDERQGRDLRCQSGG